MAGAKTTVFLRLTAFKVTLDKFDERVCALSVSIKQFVKGTGGIEARHFNSVAIKVFGFRMDADFAREDKIRISTKTSG